MFNVSGVVRCVLNFKVLISLSDQTFVIGIYPGQIISVPCGLEWNKFS